MTATKEFVNDMKNLNTDLVKATITPRFALSCTKELLRSLGDIAKEHNLHIQVYKINTCIAASNKWTIVFPNNFEKEIIDIGFFMKKRFSILEL